MPTGSVSTPGPARAEGRRDRRGLRQRHGPAVAGWAALASGSALACAALALHHPLSGALALALCTALAALAAVWPLAALALLPAVLPAIGLMPWTGWLTFEELDLAVLAVAAGACARLASGRPLVAAGPADGVAVRSSASALKALLLWAYGAALLVSIARGFSDAGGFVWGWYQGYHEAMNSLRLAKSYFLAMLLLPLWRTALRTAPERSARWLASGLAFGLMNVALLALWERWAYTGLANFSSDYRTTALFWEMHVGGAALDGFLALTLPFAVRELLRPQAPWRWALAAVAVVLGGYACLTTFSRAVYLAVPVGLVLMAALQALTVRRQRGRPRAAHTGSAGVVVIAFCLFAAAAAAVFPGSGYRGLLAVFGAVMLMLPMAAGWRTLPWRRWIAGAAAGIALAGLLGGLSLVLPKGDYVAYSLAWTAGALLLLAVRWRPALATAPWPAVSMLASWLALLPGMVLVATNWGGAPAGAPMVGTAGLLLTIALIAGRSAGPRWPESWRWQGNLLGLLTVLAISVGILLGGAYMSERFSTGSSDLKGRQQHWAQALSLLNDPLAWAFGQGTGRYPASNFLSGRAEDQTGDLRLREQGGAHHLVLSAGKHVQGWGEMFRVSQRIGAFDGPLTLRLDARADVATALHVEVCNKHLLYDSNCQFAAVSTQALPGQWQALELVLPGAGLSSGSPLAPRFVVFSVAVSDSGHSVELAHLRATDAGGRELLVNGDFNDGLARWYFSSDRNHLPWHMKNMLLHVLFEQGGVGLALFCTLVLAALWRLTAGTARDHTLAPAAAAAIIGFLIVGLFDSLLDAPRVAFLFDLLVALALLLPATTAAARKGSLPPP